MKTLLVSIITLVASLSSNAIWIAFETTTANLVQFSIRTGYEFDDQMAYYQEQIGEAVFSVNPLGGGSYLVGVDWDAGNFEKSFQLHSPFGQYDYSGFDGSAVNWTPDWTQFVWGTNPTPPVSDASNGLNLMALAILSIMFIGRKP